MSSLPPREQLSLPVLNSCAPPDTRAECASIPRPCDRYSCRQHLWPDTERQGRQHHGVAPAAKLKPVAESCALDVVEKHPDGLGHEFIAKLMGHGMTAERARQVEARAMRKMAIAAKVSEWIEEKRAELPPYARIAVNYPASNDTGSVSLRVVIDVDRPEDTKAKRRIVR